MHSERLTPPGAGLHGPSPLRFHQYEECNVIKNKELGRLLVDAGDVVCFSMDSVIRLAERLNISEDDLIARYEGVECDFRSDGNYGVDTLTAINQDGSTHSVVMIGGKPDEFLRFLNENEPTFHASSTSHPRYPEVDKGENFNRQVFNEISADYRKQLLG